MVEPSHDHLSIKTQCHLLSISRSGWYYEAKGKPPLNLKLMRLIDKQFLLTPYYGSRQMARWLKRQGAASRAAADAPDGVVRHLSGTTHEPAPSAASDLSLSLAESGCHTG